MQKVSMETCLYIWHVETTMMEWFQCYSWYSIFFLSLPTHSLLHRSKIVHVCDFLWLCEYYVGVVWKKGRREQM
jgi:hypothetical protein